MYQESYDYITYIDECTKQALTPDFEDRHRLPNKNDILSFNGGQRYRIVSIKTGTDIREIKEHGGSDFDKWATVWVERISEAGATTDFTFVIDQGVCSIVQYTGSDSTVKIPGMLDGKPVVAINVSTFSNNPHIREVEIPDSVKQLETGSFAKCTQLKTVKLPSGLEKIPESLFEGCVSLEDITIPNPVKDIGIRAFKECSSLIKIILPPSLKNLGLYAFDGCKSLESIHIPASLECYLNCYCIFHNCKSIRTIVVDPLNKKYDSRGNCNAIIETATDEMILAGAETVIPESVKKIDQYSCSCLPQHVLDAWRNSRPSPSDWSVRDKTLIENSIAPGDFRWVYMDVNQGVVHLYEYEVSSLLTAGLLFGGVRKGHIINWRELYGIELERLLKVWHSPTLEEFTTTIERKFYDEYDNFDEFRKYFLDKRGIPYQKVEQRSEHLMLYFHGIGSSNENETVKTLRELLPNWIVLAPEIPEDSEEASSFLKQYCSRLEPDLIVGEGMGGVYARQIKYFYHALPHMGSANHVVKEKFPAKRICVNPPVDAQPQDIEVEDGKNIFSLFTDTGLNRQFLEETLLPLIKDITSK